MQGLRELLAQTVRRTAIHAAEAQREEHCQHDRPTIAHQWQALCLGVLVAAFFMHDGTMTKWAGERSGKHESHESGDSKNTQSYQGGYAAEAMVTNDQAD